LSGPATGIYPVLDQETPLLRWLDRIRACKFSGLIVNVPVPNPEIELVINCVTAWRRWGSSWRWCGLTGLGG
jgi:hypothetical protein